MEELSPSEFWKFASQRIENLLAFPLRVNNEDLLIEVEEPSNLCLYTPQPSAKVNLKTSRFCRTYKNYNPFAEKIFERIDRYEPLQIRTAPKAEKNILITSPRFIDPKKKDLAGISTDSFTKTENQYPDEIQMLKVSGNKASMSLPPLKASRLRNTTPISSKKSLHNKTFIGPKELMTNLEIQDQNRSFTYKDNRKEPFTPIIYKEIASIPKRIPNRIINMKIQKLNNPRETAFGLWSGANTILHSI